MEAECSYPVQCSPDMILKELFFGIWGTQQTTFSCAYKGKHSMWLATINGQMQLSSK